MHQGRLLAAMAAIPFAYAATVASAQEAEPG